MSWIDEAEEGLEIEAKLGKAIAEAEQWKPEPGDTLIGTVRQIGAVVTKYGLALKVWVETGKDQMSQVFGSATMFKEEFLQVAPTVGRGIAIRFDGKGEGQYGKALWYVSAETAKDDLEAARKEIYATIDQAEKLNSMKQTKAASRPERDDAPAYNGTGDAGDLEAPFAQAVIG